MQHASNEIRNYLNTVNFEGRSMLSRVRNHRDTLHYLMKIGTSSTEIEVICHTRGINVGHETLNLMLSYTR